MIVHLTRKMRRLAQGDCLEKDEKPPTQRQMAALERRKHIVETAAICFIEQGFHQTSIRDIAKRAGISLGNLYNHFESKTALIGEIASLEADDLIQIRTVLEHDGPALERLNAFVAAYFDYVSRPENAVLTAEITAEAMRSPQIAKGFSDNRRRIIDAVIDVLGTDAISFPERTEEMAEMLLDLIESAAGRVAFEKKKAKVSTRADLQSVIQRLLGCQSSD